MQYYPQDPEEEFDLVDNLEESRSNLPESPPVTPTAPTKKRSRSSKRGSGKPKGVGVNIVGNRFCCSYTGHMCERAIFIPGVEGAAFANIPSAFAWIDIQSSMDDETKTRLKQQLCDFYHQLPTQVIHLPPRERLKDFGGVLSYEEWMGQGFFWDVHAQREGTTVEAYRAGLSKKSRRGANEDQLVLQKGMQVILPGKSIATSVKRVTAVDELPKVKFADGEEVQEDDATEKRPKNRLTPLGCWSKLSNFVSKNNPALWEKRAKVLANDSGMAFFVTARADYGDQNVHKTIYNEYGSRLLCEDAFGPVVVISQRRQIIKTK